MYLLDGDMELPLFARMFRLSNSGTDGTGSTVDSDPAQVIFVGVGYPSSVDPMRPPPGGGEIAYRQRDYSPPPFPASNPEHKTWQSEQPWAGGAPLFLRVLKEELIPLIDRQFRTSADRGLHGHSMGGLFATYALFTEPDLFTRYAITSPSLWWDCGSIFEREAEFAKTRRSLPKQVFVDEYHGSADSSAVPFLTPHTSHLTPAVQRLAFANSRRSVAIISPRLSYSFFSFRGFRLASA